VASAVLDLSTTEAMNPFGGKKEGEQRHLCVSNKYGRVSCNNYHFKKKTKLKLILV
jgi:hypothetical protein